MKKAQVAEIWRRAGDCCEYCRVPGFAVSDTLQIDHVISKKLRGASTLSNLALCCLHCNCHKGSIVAGYDPLTGKLTRLFNSRRDQWKTCFALRGATLVGKSPIGRLTVDVLQMIDEDQIGLRQDLLDNGIFPH